MKEVRASLSIEVNVKCPNCGHYIDLLDPYDTNGVDLNEEGQILKQALPDGHWSEEHEKFKIDNVECPECKAEFNVRQLD